VHVLLIVDWVGSMETPRRFWNRLRRGGVDVRLFQRPGLRRWLGLVPRDHRKLLVVDRSLGFTGGFGLADAWSVGDDALGEAGGGRWRDTGIRIEGPAVADMRASFGRMWRRANRRNTFEDLGENEWPDTTDGAVVGIVEGLPLRMRSERAFHYHTAVAGRSIWIANAYFTPARPQIEALGLAARDGVDVRILVPSRYDHPWVRRFTRGSYRRLLASGVRIWEWQGPMMHAKTHVVDALWVRVGSTDLNPLGVVVNYELDAAVCDEALGSEASELFLRDLHHSREIT
jgi:cardiolipin synthase